MAKAAQEELPAPAHCSGFALVSSPASSDATYNVRPRFFIQNINEHPKKQGPGSWMQTNFGRYACINPFVSMGSANDVTSGVLCAVLLTPAKKGHCRIRVH